MQHITLYEKDVFCRHGYSDKAIYSHIIEYEEVLPHNHEFIEFFYVFEGTCNHLLNGELQVLHVGDALVLPPSDIHQYIPSNTTFLHRDFVFKLDFFKTACEFYSPDLFQKIIGGEMNLRIKLSVEQMSKIEAYVPFLSLESENEKHQLAAHSLITYLLNLIIENNLDESYRYPAWLTRLLSMLSTHENLNVQLSQILKNFAYTKEHMRRTFKKYIGTSMTDFFNTQKMSYAYALLTTTSYSVERICEAIGITNISYFYQLFKKTYGITPHSLRKS
ncbi:MAG: AraC family transcriptional regulator [Clostridia bacterium]|nr:AraC family transcriptional regulator [Clostridia bacterium]